MYPTERLNTLTHFAGALLALLGLILLVSTAVKSGDAIRIAGFAVFGAALVILYACSTLYHGARGNAELGLGLLLAVCLLSGIGIALELTRRTQSRVLSVCLYVLMGWLGIIAVKPLFGALGATGFAWLVAGGLLYTAGLIFYALDTRLRHAHGIWHVFVMGGSTAHVGAVLYFV